MKRVFIGTLVLFNFLFLFCRIINCAEDNKKTQSLQNTQQTLSKPVLSFTVSNPLPGASPAFLPDISAPSIMSNTMNAQNNNTNTKLRNSQKNISVLPSLPKLPVLPLSSTSVAGSVSSVFILPQKIQLIKSLLGTVTKIGSEKEDILWLDVENKFSGETVRINVDLKKTRVIKKDVLPVALRDIKVGDMVRVIFNQAGKSNPVNVISIIIKEDLKTSTQPE